MSTADPTSIPLVILPPPVPPALVRQRPPQASIPQTKQERDALFDAVRRGIASERAVPPLSRDELARRADAALAEVGLGPVYRDYATVLVNNESVARAARRRALRAAAPVDAEMPAGGEPLPRALRRVRPALQAVRPLLDPGLSGGGGAARLRRPRCGGFGTRDGDGADRHDRGDRRRELHAGAREDISARAGRGDPGGGRAAPAGRLHRHDRRRGLGVGLHPPRGGGSFAPARPRRPA